MTQRAGPGRPGLRLIWLAARAGDMPAAWARPAPGADPASQLRARSITDPGRQVGALTWVAEALARAGQHEQAETLARSITDQ